MYVCMYQSFWSLITIVASDWPRTFLQPGCFCLAYIYIYAKQKQPGCKKSTMLNKNSLAIKKYDANLKPQWL